MIKLDVALRYSKVLFNFDLKRDYLRDRLNDFDFILQLFKSNPEFFRFLKSPQIGLAQKQEFLERSLPILEPNFLLFLIYLIKKKRLEYLEAIATKYRKLVNEHFGVWEAEVITAIPIESNLEKKLTQKLEDFFQKRIKIHKQTQPEIIGGAILIIGDSMIDWSIANRLKKLEKSLLE